MNEGTSAAVVEVVRREWPRVVATLMRDLGDLSRAEDAAQEAVEAALSTWPTAGLPDRPAAWITTVARRRAIDHLRREQRGRDKAEQLGRLEGRIGEGLDGSAGFDPDEETIVRDDQLRLLFGCCHPALSIEAQMALTLRSIGGLSTPEIARAFLVPEPTMAQRIVRAKRKIAKAAIPFVIPPDSELLQRLAVVRNVIYLVFNEGYNSTAGEDVVRVDLCEEAIRLARLVASLVSDDPENLGLLALCVLTHARAEARTNAAGDIVLLDEQDRSLWNSTLIEEGEEALARAMRLARPGPFQLQAAIAATHADARVATDTDWAAIELLYGRLIQLADTPVVRLNHAVAAAMARGPQAGLDLLGEPELSQALDAYGYFHAAVADLEARRGDVAAAANAYRRAIDATVSEAELRLLRRKLAALATN